MANTWPKDRRLIGTRVQRIDGPDKATGHAKYSYDKNLTGMLYGVILRCPYAHAKLTSIDITAAEKMPGVKAVHEIAKAGAEFFYAGDEIVGLAADTEEHAADALRAVAETAKYEVLPAQVKEEDALKEDKSTTPPTAGNRTNVRPGQEQNTGDVETAFKEADAVIEGNYGAALIAHQCLESHGLVAHWEADDKLTVWCSTQAVFGTAGELAKTFSIPAPNVKCITHYMGGGFGSKFGPDIQGIVAAHLAKKAKAPVKLMLNRADEITTAGTRPSTYGKIKMAAKKDGTITSYQAETYGSAGIGTGVGVQLPYVYAAIPNQKKKHTVVRLNASMSRAMRAPNHPQSCILTDCPLDDLAAKLGMDPLQMRLKNLPPNDEKAVASAPQSYNALKNTIYVKEIEIAAKMANWEKTWHPPGKGPATGPVKHGIGMALHTWGGQGFGPNDTNVTISSDGSVLVESSTQDLGTAERTTLPIVVAEILGLTVADITVHIGESQFGRSSGSGGSTTCPSISPSALNAVSAARDNLFAALADRLKVDKESISIEPGKIVIGAKDDKKTLTWKEACAKLGMDTIKGQGNWTPGLSNQGVGGVQIAEVLVDTETGVVRCTRMVAVQDCGMIVNKLGCESQVAGGVIMGLNYALFEESILDRNTGRQTNPDMEFYKLGGIQDMPRIDVHMYDMPERGVIGIGEPPTISTAAAIGNAIFNAIGMRVPYTPYTPDRVLAALNPRKEGKG